MRFVGSAFINSFVGLHRVPLLIYTVYSIVCVVVSMEQDGFRVSVDSVCTTQRQIQRFSGVVTIRHS